MPVVRDPDDLPARHGTGWTQHVWASPRLLGAMQAWRWVLDPAAVSPALGLGAPEGLLCTDRQVARISAGMSAPVGPGEVHRFVSDTAADFSFVEFWAPPPAGTVWTVAGDRRTWAPAS
jgi:hypothetical protein